MITLVQAPFQNKVDDLAGEFQVVLTGIASRPQHWPPLSRHIVGVRLPFSLARLKKDRKYKLTYIYTH